MVLRPSQHAAVASHEVPKARSRPGASALRDWAAYVIARDMPIGVRAIGAFVVVASLLGSLVPLLVR